jgi:hypothetical protein
MIVAPDKTTESVVSGLQSVANRYCSTFRLIHSDQFSALKSPKLLDSLRKLGHLDCQVSLAPVAAHNCNPTERFHQELWSQLRCRKFTVRLTRAMQAGSSQDVLDAVCAVINSRPIAVERGQLIITPATLAFGPQEGSTWNRHEKVGWHLREIRREFFESYFDQLRRRFQSSRVVRASIHPGRLVLIRNPNTNSKDEMKLDVGKVIGVEGAKVKILVRGNLLSCGSNQIVPLADHFQPDGESAPPGDTPAANCEGQADEASPEGAQGGVLGAAEELGEV